MSSQYHTTKDGKKARKGLYYNINQKKNLKVDQIQNLNQQFLMMLTQI